MAIVMTRFARAGAVGFVVAWTSATLAMTAASLSDESRSAAETGSGEPPATSDLDEAAEREPAPTIAPPTASAAPTTGSATSTTTISPAHLGGGAPAAPAATEPVAAESVRTEVLPAVTDAARPSPAQPDFTG